MKIADNIREFCEKKKVLPKVVSLALAVLLWFYIDIKKVGSISFTVNVVPVNLSADMIISEMPKKGITVTAKGNKEDLKNITKKIFVAELDLRNPVVGSLSKYDVILNVQEQYDSIKYDVSDKTLFAKVEKKLSKKVPVELKTEGNVKESLEIVKKKITPDFCTITGAESEISSIEAVQTEIIKISGEKDSFKKSARIKLSSDRISVVPDNVNVVFSVLPQKDIVKISVPVVFRNDNQNYSFEPSSAAVSLIVKNNGQGAPDPSDIVCYIDYSAYDPRVDTEFNSEGFVYRNFPVRFNADKHFSYQVVSIEPETIKVKIGKKVN